MDLAKKQLLANQEERKKRLKEKENGGCSGAESDKSGAAKLQKAAAELKKIACPFHKEGKCHFGEKCRYSHE